MSTPGQYKSSFLLWLARQYGYAFSRAFRFKRRQRGLAPSMYEVTLVRDNSPSAVERRMQTMRAFPAAGYGGPLPGVPIGGVGAGGAQSPVVADVRAWRDVLIRESSGYGSDVLVAAMVLDAAAFGWMVYSSSVEVVAMRGFLFALVVAIATSLLLAFVIVGRRIQKARIDAAGYRKVVNAFGEPMYVHRSDVGWSL